jgi:hypothetical protein
MCVSGVMKIGLLVPRLKCGRTHTRRLRDPINVLSALRNRTGRAGDFLWEDLNFVSDWPDDVAQSNSRGLIGWKTKFIFYCQKKWRITVLLACGA